LARGLAGARITLLEVDELTLADAHVIAVGETLAQDQWRAIHEDAPLVAGDLDASGAVEGGHQPRAHAGDAEVDVRVRSADRQSPFDQPRALEVAQPHRR